MAADPEAVVLVKYTTRTYGLNYDVSFFLRSTGGKEVAGRQLKTY